VSKTLEKLRGWNLDNSSNHRFGALIFLLLSENIGLEDFRVPLT